MFIKEAGLPCAERMSAGRAEQSLAAPLRKSAVKDSPQPRDVLERVSRMATGCVG